MQVQARECLREAYLLSNAWPKESVLQHEELQDSFTRVAIAQALAGTCWKGNQVGHGTLQVPAMESVVPSNKKRYSSQKQENIPQVFGLFFSFLSFSSKLQALGLVFGLKPALKA